MPIIKSAKKALRSSRRKKVMNDRRMKALRTVTKETRKLITSDTKTAAAKLKEAYQAIDKAAKRGVIKKNAAARKKSRLAKALAKAAK